MIQQEHWATALQLGDRCYATIRHKEGGSKNIHNAAIIVAKNNPRKSQIVGVWMGQEIDIPYNELTRWQ